MQRPIAVLAATLSIAYSAVAQEPEGDWKNSELEAKNLPAETYSNVGKSTLATCKADSRPLAQSEYMRAMTGCPDEKSLFCSLKASTARDRANQVLKDAVVSCMAGKGWYWYPAP